jgi:hypothetical protein
MTMKRLFLTLTLAAAMAVPALAYEQPTHRVLTDTAVRKTWLFTDHSLMFNLGLLGAGEQEFLYYLRSGKVRVGIGLYDVAGLVAEGAVDEDDPGRRALNHFFDPVNHRPLTIAGVPIGRQSWEWAVEDEPIEGGLITVGQDRSLRDARDFLERSLMFNQGDPAEAEGERGIAVSNMFLSLGHAMHHMQDMAQPQHVRNDQHLSGPFTSRYEDHTNTIRDRVDIRALMDGSQPNFPGSPDFKIARDFWFNDAGTGIAQGTNRDFLSQGTNFTMTADGAATTDYALPAPDGTTDYTAQELLGPLPTGLQERCGTLGADCTMTMYGTTLNERASTYSVFDQDLRATGLTVFYDRAQTRVLTNRFFDLNRINFEDVYRYLIPRAVAYSGGIVNHFFRGRLQVTAPKSGAYAVADHATAQAFHKVRVTVKNTTANERLAGGSIYVVAKYHRNPCYKADLTGEFTNDAAGNPVPPCTNFRTQEQYVSTSLPQDVAFEVDQEKELTFTILDEGIPFNATDLVLHVYYRGWVGAEEKSFALGAIDIAEPTYLAIYNGTDTFQLEGAFYYWRDIVANIAVAPYKRIDIDENGAYTVPPDWNVTGGDMSFEIIINGMKVADAPAVPEGRFTRLALLVDQSGFEESIVGRGTTFVRGGTSHFPAKIFQGSTFYPVRPVRSQFQQNNASTFYAYLPVATADIETMPKSLMPDAGVAFPMQMAPGLVLNVAAADNWANSLSVFGVMQARALAPMRTQLQSNGVARPVRPTMTGPMTSGPAGRNVGFPVKAK